MDVGDWLRSLGLGQYETLFRQNDIDAEVLSELTEGDLEKFGLSFGHRKRLLKAIASLGSTETALKPAAPVALQTSTDAAERRQLTVMFCDLVGSTAMSARLDPISAGRSRRSAHACARPDRDLTGYPGAPPRADQAPGRACERSDAHQRLRGA
jgi:hypothetical protein